jgi:lipopolysaccharide-induced tumor necrosis factor-alpha factor
MDIKCPFCGHEGPPQTKRQISVAGWVLFVVLIFLCLPLCWLPFVIDGCKEDIHKCMKCRMKLG